VKRDPLIKRLNVNYSPSPPTIQHRRERLSRARSVHFTLDGLFRSVLFSAARRGINYSFEPLPFPRLERGGGDWLKETVINMEEATTKRYVVHDFSIGSPVLIDRMENTMTFYDHNIYGQIYNLKNPEHHTIDAKRINGLIKRTNNPDYSFANSKAVDGYIYKYILTPEQQAMCRRTPYIPGYSELITATDSKAEAIKAMCEWVYEHEYPAGLGDKDAERGRLLKYCDDFLAGKQSPPPAEKQNPPPAGRKQADRGDR
jgi:hypothetical protein